MSDSPDSTTPYRKQVQYATVTERGIAWVVDIVVVILIAVAIELVVFPFLTYTPVYWS